MKEFLNKNKVFITGLLAAILVVLQQYVGQPEVSFKVVGYAVFVAAVSYLARNLRGQWQTIVTAVGTLVSTFVTMQQAGEVSWNQIILQAMILLIGIATGPVKLQDYEKDKTIVKAKNDPTIVKP